MNNWRPGATVAAARLRAQMLDNVRDYFARERVLPVDTPALGVATVTEPNIDSIVTDDGRYLQTSPEYFMKRLLAAGYPDIYSICRVFRAGERGRRHLPEFTLVEWYRHNFTLPDIVSDTCRLIGKVLEQPRLDEDRQVMSYQAAFLRFAGLDPICCGIAELAQLLQADADLKATLGENRDAWLDLAMSVHIAPLFTPGRLTVITHYPASQAALARLCPANPQLADRFEVYYGNLELANGYVELRDAEEQSTRMDRDRAARQALGLRAVPRDEHLLAALDHGLPDCAGVALGFERLHMLAARTDNIQEVVSFT